MTDVKSVLGGRSSVVERPRRADAKTNGGLRFTAFEKCDIVRNDDGVVVDTITPGMLVLAIVNDADATKTRAECLAHPDRLACFYVLEFIQPEGHGADMLVLRARTAVELFAGWAPEILPQFNLHESDFVIGDRPFYASVDSLLAAVPAVIERREPPKAFLACCVAKTNKNLDNLPTNLAITPLTRAHAALHTYKDAAASFLSLDSLLPTTSLPPTPIEQDNGSEGKKKRNIDQVSLEDTVQTAAPAPTVTTAIVQAPMPANHVAAQTTIVVLPDVMRGWRTHQQALSQAIHEFMSGKTMTIAEMRMLRFNAKWQQQCMRTERELKHADSTFVEFVYQIAMTNDDAFVEYMAQLPVPIDQLCGLPFVAVHAYKAVGALTAQAAGLPALSPQLRVRINDRRLARFIGM
jgi:hypothetical protein